MDSQFERVISNSSGIAVDLRTGVVATAGADQGECDETSVDSKLDHSERWCLFNVLSDP